MKTRGRQVHHIIAGLCALMIVLAPRTTWAQGEIENVIVETYYIADANDATDTIGGGVVEGSRTYRVYIDLAPGNALRAVYGRTDHPLVLSSTAPFFNHLDRGRTYGHEINTNALDEGTVALDSWLALGGASNQRKGVLKAMDPDGSIIGGPNSDGGSGAIIGGLLTNVTSELGIPLTEQDGLHPNDGSPVLPPTFLFFGDDPTRAFRDSTLESAFTSTDFRMGCGTPGVQGPTAENHVLVAQITTAGELTFELNVEVQRADGSVVHFVARDTLLDANETPNGLLTYPPQCGCTDPNFLEYDQSAGCDDGSCQTAIVFGCLDIEACNYDPGANFNIPQLCCYGPEACNGLDVDIVCPDVSVAPVTDPGTAIAVYPNPTLDGALHVRTESEPIKAIRLYDLYGRLVAYDGTTQGARSTITIPVDRLQAGAYLLSVTTTTGEQVRRVTIQ